MPIKLNGSSSGYTQIEAASVAGNNTLTLPTASGTLMTTGGTNTFTANQVIEVTDDTNAALRITQLGTGNALLVEDSTNPDSTPFVVDASGKVGIGTASPSFALDVSSNTNYMTRFGGTLNNYLGIQIANASNGSSACSYLQFGNDALGYASYIGHNSSTSTQPGGANALTLYQTLNAPMVFFTNNAERMRIDSSGNVGIGTSSPSALFDVRHSANTVAKIKTTGSGSFGALQISNSNTNGEASIGFRDDSDADAASWVIGKSVGATDAFGFYYNGTKMLIDTSGNVLLNTTDTTLYDNTSGTGVCYRAGASFDVLSSSDNAVILNRAGTNGSIQEFRKAGTIVGSVSVTTTATAYNTSSDYRLKEDIKPIEGATQRLNALKPVNFAWKIDGSRVDGFIAHEAQSVVPEAVTGEKDAVDENGNPVYQGIDQSKLVPLLTAALQDAILKIDALETRIAALENA